VECWKNDTGVIHQLYCGDGAQDSDPYCQYYREHDVYEKPGIPGLSSVVFFSTSVLKFDTISSKDIHLHRANNNWHRANNFSRDLSCMKV